jgi:Tfp pilus assembly protein FimT
MKKGSSLVELLVSISIITILSTIGVRTFYIVQSRYRVEEEVSKVVFSIRQAQTSSLSPSRSETGIPDTEKLCSIGVSLDKNNNTIQAFYRTLSSSGSSCNMTKFSYGSLIKLSNVNINSNVDFEFDIPFANTSERVVVLNSDIVNKKITVTSAGLIKVQ